MSSYRFCINWLIDRSIDRLVGRSVSRSKKTEIKLTSHRSDLGDTMATLTDSVTNFGDLVDENVFMDKHIGKAVCVSIKNIIMIWMHINQPVAGLLTHALITSRLYVSNSLLHGLNKTQLQRIQRLQNTAAIFHAFREIRSHHIYSWITTLATNRTANLLQNIHVCI